MAVQGSGKTAFSRYAVANERVDFLLVYFFVTRLLLFIAALLRRTLVQFVRLCSPLNAQHASKLLADRLSFLSTCNTEVTIIFIFSCNNFFQFLTFHQKRYVIAKPLEPFPKVGEKLTFCNFLLLCNCGTKIPAPAPIA
jgi:hypothetical protein